MASLIWAIALFAAGVTLWLTLFFHSSNAQGASASHVGDVGAPRLPLFPGPLPGSQSETPSGSFTPSVTPSISDSSSATPSPTGTSTGTPSGTSSTSPSATPSISVSSVFGTRQCAQAAADYLNRTNAGILERCLHVGGSQNRLPLGADVAHGALWAACPAGAAEATYWQYASSLQPSDICYVVLSKSSEGTQAVAAGWGRAVPLGRLWFVGPQADLALGVAAVPGLAGLAQERWLTRVIPAIAAQPNSASCKWIFIGSDTSWVNPRVLLHAVRGLPHDTIPSFQGFMWVDQGFTSEITATNGGTSLWSRAAWDAIVARLGTAECPDSIALGLPSDELAVASCADKSGALAFDFHLYDGTGAVQQNGVPLEPGPPHGERLAWLAESATRAGHWAWIDGMGPSWQRSIWAQYLALHGPWGSVGGTASSSSSSGGGGGADIPSASPGATAAAAALEHGGDYYAPPPATTPACALRATAALRGLLEATRSGPTAAQALTMELASGVVSEECAPGNPLGGQGLARAVEEHLCYLLWEQPGEDSVGNNARLFSVGWGWRTPHVDSGSGGSGGAAHARRRLWLASADGTLVAAAPPPAPSLLTLLAAWARLPETSHCDYLYLGSNTDWVHGAAMATMLRALRPDIPTRVGGLFQHSSSATPGSVVESPALHRQVLSRAAISALVGVGGEVSGVCRGGLGGGGPGDASWGLDFSACAWARGIVPIGSYTMDVANFGPITDWAFQLPHYLNGWALIVDQNYDRAHHILESYWSGIYGQCLNATPVFHRGSVAEFFTPWGYPPCPADVGMDRVRALGVEGGLGQGWQGGGGSPAGKVAAALRKASHFSSATAHNSPKH